MTPGVGGRAHRAVHDRRARAPRRAPATSSTSWCAAASRSTAARRGTRRCPTKTSMPAPRTPYGASLLEVEAIAAGRRPPPRRPGRARCATRRSSARTCRARSAGCCGCRSCRCPRSPTRRSRCCTPTTRPRRWSPRSMRRYDGPLNVVGPGAATPWQAVRLGGRVPLPVVGAVVGRGARASPSSRARAIAPHVVELLRHGRTGAGGRAVEALGLARPAPDADRCCASCSSGPTSSRSRPAARQVA